MLDATPRAEEHLQRSVELEQNHRQLQNQPEREFCDSASCSPLCQTFIVNLLFHLLAQLIVAFSSLYQKIKITLRAEAFHIPTKKWGER